MEQEIKKKVDRYYYGKIFIVVGLLISLLMTCVGAIIYTFAENKIVGNFATAGYVAMIFFMVIALIFPVGKYDLKKHMGKKDIISICNFLSNLDCGKNKYLEALLIIKRTVKEMVHDRSTMNRSFAQEDEAVLNQAWDCFDLYLSSLNIKEFDRESVSNYATNLGKQIKNGSVDFYQLQNATNSMQAGKTTKKKPTSYGWLSVAFLIMITFILVALVIFKILIAIEPGLYKIDDGPWKIIYQTGTDVIACVFAMYSIKSEIQGLK